MEEILELAKKVAEEAEVFIVTSEDTSVQFQTNRLKHIQTKQSTSVALRIIKEGRVGFAVSNQVEDTQRLVAMALETAPFGMVAKFELPSPAKYPRVDIFDSKVESVPAEEMVRLGDEMVTKLRAHTPELLCDSAVSKGAVSVRIINSCGTEANYHQSVFSTSVWGHVVRDTDMLFVGEGQSSCQPILESDAVTNVVLQQLELAKERASIATKSMPVIFTPNGIASAIISPLIAAFNGKLVLEGASPIGSKLGQVVFDKQFSLADDATLTYRPTSSPCDDEGVPSQRLPLIEAGTVANFFYDLQTAARANTRSTGSGRRSRGGLPSPGLSAFIVKPGKMTFDEMVGDIKEGLVVEDVMGAEQGNILGGDFSGNVLLGFKVENGKMVGRVKDTMISGNVYDLLKHILAIGSEAKWAGSFLYTPPIYFPVVSVASK